MPEITHAEQGRLQAKVGKYVEEMREAMWVGHWDLNVKVVEHPGDDENTDAAVLPTEHRHHALLEISLGAARVGGEQLRHTVVHEFLHLHHRDAHDIVRLTLPGALSQSAYDIFWENYRQVTELMIDDIATAWSQTLPLPDWSEDD